MIVTVCLICQTVKSPQGVLEGGDLRGAGGKARDRDPMPVTVCFPWNGNLGNGGKSVLRAAARLNELVAVATARDSSCAVRRFVPRILPALLVYAPPREGAPPYRSFGGGKKIRDQGFPFFLPTRRRPRPSISSQELNAHSRSRATSFYVSILFRAAQSTRPSLTRTPPALSSRTQQCHPLRQLVPPAVAAAAYRSWCSAISAARPACSTTLCRWRRRRT